MIEDVRAVVWKELREARGQPMTFVSAGVLLVILGVVLPYRLAGHFIGSVFPILTWVLLPLAIMVTTIADAFAGERERHTLETLLATRLSDTAILVGKIASSVGIAAVLVLAEMVVSIVAVNVAAPGAGIPSASILVGGYALALLTAVLLASIGVLVSLWASTVRAAQQALGLVIAVLGASVSTSPAWLPTSWQREIAKFIATNGEGTLLLAAVAILAVVDVALLVACRARFRRQRLVLGT